MNLIEMSQIQVIPLGKGNRSENRFPFMNPKMKWNDQPRSLSAPMALLLA
jgi:hypothetical protein